MIIEYIRYRLSSHKPEELIAAYQAAGEYLKASPECLGYEFSQCEEEPNAFVLRINWTSTEGHIEGFRKSANFPPFLKAIRPFFAEIEEMHHYAPTEVCWTRD